MRLVGVAVLGGEQRPVRARQLHRLGGERADPGLPGQQFRPHADLAGETALQLADAEVHLVGQPAHRDPAAASLDQPDRLPDLRARLFARSSLASSNSASPPIRCPAGSGCSSATACRNARGHTASGGAIWPTSSGTGRPTNAPAAPGKNEMFTWSIVPWNCSQVARLIGPTTAADGTAQPPQSCTSTGSPKQTGTDTSPAPKSSTDTSAGAV